MNEELQKQMEHLKEQGLSKEEVKEQMDSFIDTLPMVDENQKDKILENFEEDWSEV